jgi:hypothetical protein
MLPYVVPGLHFSDTIMGKFTFIHDTLALSIQNELLDLEWKYKVKILTKDSLVIQDITTKPYEGNREIWFERQ